MSHLAASFLTGSFCSFPPTEHKAKQRAHGNVSSTPAVCVVGHATWSKKVLLKHLMHRGSYCSFHRSEEKTVGGHERRKTREGVPLGNHFLISHIWYSLFSGEKNKTKKTPPRQPLGLRLSHLRRCVTAQKVSFPRRRACWFRTLGEWHHC